MDYCDLGANGVKCSFGPFLSHFSWSLGPKEPNFLKGFCSIQKASFGIDLIRGSDFQILADVDLSRFQIANNLLCAAKKKEGRKSWGRDTATAMECQLACAQSCHDLRKNKWHCTRSKRTPPFPLLLQCKRRAIWAWLGLFESLHFAPSYVLVLHDSTLSALAK